MNWIRSSRCSTANNCVEVAWSTSSRCEMGNCVEVGFRTSSRCESGHCVEVNVTEHVVYVRDSKLGNESPVLEYTAEQWRKVLDAVGADEWLDGFDDFWAQWATGAPDGTIAWIGPHHALDFTRAEIDAFVAGVLNGEFRPESSHVG